MQTQELPQAPPPLPPSPRQTLTKCNSLRNLSKGKESEHFDSNHLNEINQFIEDDNRYFYPPEDPDDYRFDVGYEHKLVEDVDTQTLIRLVNFLKRGKPQAPIPYTMRYLG